MHLFLQVDGLILFRNENEKNKNIKKSYTDFLQSVSK